MHIDRRRSPRIELLGEVRARSAAAATLLVVREMSLGGMAIETPEPFVVGSVHTFLVTLGNQSTVELTGQVMHNRPSTSAEGTPVYVAGIQFVDEEQEDTAAQVISQPR